MNFKHFLMENFHSDSILNFGLCCIIFLAMDVEGHLSKVKEMEWGEREGQA